MRRGRGVYGGVLLGLSLLAAAYGGVYGLKPRGGYNNDHNIISLVADPLLVGVGEKVKLTATLIPADDSSPSGVRVTFEFGDGATGESVANAEGIAEIEHAYSTSGHKIALASAPNYQSANNGPKAKAEVDVRGVIIKAEDGMSDPSACIGVGGKLKFKAVTVPSGRPGTFEWESKSSKLSLTDATSQTVLVKAGNIASAENESETITVRFSPTDGGGSYEATHDLRIRPVAPLALIGVNGNGFMLYDNAMDGFEKGPYPNRPWVGTWLTFDANPFTEMYGGDGEALLLTSQSFSWELKDRFVNEEFNNQMGPTWFLDHFRVDQDDGEAKLDVIAGIPSGVRFDEHEKTGMHISLLSVAIASLIMRTPFSNDPNEPLIIAPFRAYDGKISITFTAKIYHRSQVENPSEGFSESTNNINWHPFYPEYTHKLSRNTEPEWSRIDPLATMQQTLTVSWTGGDTPTVKMDPVLPVGPNRYGRDEWGRVILNHEEP